MDEELKLYLERLREENMKAHLQTWFKLAALERRIDAVSVDNAASNAETRLHIDVTVEQMEQRLERITSSAEVHFRRDGRRTKAISR